MVTPGKPNLPAAPEPGAGEELYYDVMPRGGGGEVVEPSGVPAAPAVPAAPESPIMMSDEHLQPHDGGSHLLSRFIVLIAVALLAGGGWYAYQSGLVPNLNLSFLKKQPALPGDGSGGPAAAPKLDPAWTARYWADGCDPQTLCGEQADPDRDGLLNIDEQTRGTDPNNPDSDSDGLSDGDELHVFSTDPLNPRTAGDPEYNDGQYINGGYDVMHPTSTKLSTASVADIVMKIAGLGLHEPSVATIHAGLLTVYVQPTSTPATEAPATSTPATSTPASSTPDALKGFDLSAEAKQDRDTRRSNAVTAVAVGTVRYKQKHGTYPNAKTFTDAYAKVKPYLKVAVNAQDPVNKDPYVYGYQVLSGGKDFQVTFQSETQGQLIKIKAAQAQKYLDTQEADLADERRRADLDTLRGALLLYSQTKAASTTDPDAEVPFMFPSAERYKSELVPKFISSLPKDPTSGKDYAYTVNAKLDSFTLTAELQNPSAGTTGVRCTEESCLNY